MVIKLRIICLAIFEKLNLSKAQIIEAESDIDIFVEKYISISEDNMEFFKKDREAYLIKISSNDIQDLTKIKAISSAIKPLQCTDAFFNPKKTIIKNKKCDIINLCFRRTDSVIFGDSPFIVQFSLKGTYGIAKFPHYVEEEYITNVIQRISENL